MVDSNYLQCHALRVYLEDRKTNLVALTEYCAMEAYKGDTLVSIYKSMEILSEFPTQVLLLKSTTDASRLIGRSAGLTRRLIIPGGTADFVKFCAFLRKARSGETHLSDQLLTRGQWAKNHFAQLYADAGSLQDLFENVAGKIFSTEEIAGMRRGHRPALKTVTKIVDLTLDFMVATGQRLPGGFKIPKTNEVYNTFIFRYCLCLIILMHRWIREGGRKEIKIEKLVNDGVDANFVAFGTFFDDILSNDRKLRSIYAEALAILDHLKAALQRQTILGLERSLEEI